MSTEDITYDELKRIVRDKTVVPIIDVEQETLNASVGQAFSVLRKLAQNEDVGRFDLIEKSKLQDYRRLLNAVNAIPWTEEEMGSINDPEF